MVPTRTKNEIVSSSSLQSDDSALFDSAVDFRENLAIPHRSNGRNSHVTRSNSATDRIGRGVIRTLDIGASLFLLIVLFPLFLIVALFIRIDSAGPILFVQRRVGLKGKEFPLYKFRSMAPDAERRRPLLDTHNEQDGPLFKMRNDPRITRVGRILRKYSLDELPQLINIFKGEMSLVGPRPALPQEVAQYTTYQRGRLAVKPGLTGLWQVSGRADLSFDRAVELDLYYIANQSLWLDLWILARTLPAVVLARGAY